MGMGGSSSHFFSERLNPSTESSGQDWFPVDDRMISAPVQITPPTPGSAFPPSHPFDASTGDLGCTGSEIPEAISGGTRGLAESPQGQMLALMPHC